MVVPPPPSGSLFCSCVLSRVGYSPPCGLPNPNFRNKKMSNFKQEVHFSGVPFFNRFHLLLVRSIDFYDVFMFSFKNLVQRSRLREREEEKAVPPQKGGTVAKARRRKQHTKVEEVTTTSTPFLHYVVLRYFTLLKKMNYIQVNKNIYCVPKGNDTTTPRRERKATTKRITIQKARRWMAPHASGRREEGSHFGPIRLDLARLFCGSFLSVVVVCGDVGVWGSGCIGMNGVCVCLCVSVCVCLCFYFPV